MVYLLTVPETGNGATASKQWHILVYTYFVTPGTGNG